MSEAAAYDPHSTITVGTGDVRSGMAAGGPTIAPAPTRLDEINGTIIGTHSVLNEIGIDVAAMRLRLLGNINPPPDATTEEPQPAGLVATVTLEADCLHARALRLRDEIRDLLQI